MIIFRLLSPTILVFAVLKPIGWLLYATGNVRRSLNMAFVTAPLVILGYVAGIRYGPNGVALGLSAAVLLLAGPMTVWSVHKTGISPQDVWLTMKPPLLSAVIASGVGLGARFFCGDTLSSVPRLVVVMGVVVGSYFWLLLYPMGQRQAFMDLLRDLRKVL